MLGRFGDRLSIRVRLVLGVGLLLCVASLAVGAAAVAWTRAILVEQVDDRLLGARADPPRSHAPPSSTIDPTGRSLAVLHFSPDGELRASMPSGTSEDPDPLPALTRLDSSSVDRGVRILTVDSVDGDLRYRYLAVARPDGGVTAFATPLTEVAAVVDRVRMVTALAAGAAVLLGSGLGWWLLGRNLRPLGQLATTAMEVADGAYDVRLPAGPTGTEVGTLTTAFNHMMGRVEESFGVQLSARRELEAFIADASHELRTPLATIRGYAELHARGGITSPGQLDHAMTQIAAQSVHMTDLVDDLLVLARLDDDARTGAATAEAVPFVQIVEEMLAEHRLLDPERPITVDLRGEAVVAGDPMRLRQAVRNLLTNVRAHAGPVAPFRLATRVSGSQVELVVADSGPGIDPEFRERIFARFYRVDPGRSATRAGSGLGLAIVRATVRAHRGSILVEETPGGGATFIVRLPTSDPG
ncbi:MAG: sensor histidine kinase [Nocardioides sp.]